MGPQRDGPVKWRRSPRKLIESVVLFEFKSVHELLLSEGKHANFHGFGGHSFSICILEPCQHQSNVVMKYLIPPRKTSVQQCKTGQSRWMWSECKGCSLQSQLPDDFIARFHIMEQNLVLLGKYVQYMVARIERKQRDDIPIRPFGEFVEVVRTPKPPSHPPPVELAENFSSWSPSSTWNPSSSQWITPRTHAKDENDENDEEWL